MYVREISTSPLWLYIKTPPIILLRGVLPTPKPLSSQFSSPNRTRFKTLLFSPTIQKNFKLWISKINWKQTMVNVWNCAWIDNLRLCVFIKFIKYLVVVNRVLGTTRSSAPHRTRGQAACQVSSRIQWLRYWTYAAKMPFQLCFLGSQWSSHNLKSF